MPLSALDLASADMVSGPSEDAWVFLPAPTLMLSLRAVLGAPFSTFLLLSPPLGDFWLLPKGCWLLGRVFRVCGASCLPDVTGGNAVPKQGGNWTPGRVKPMGTCR